MWLLQYGMKLCVPFCNSHVLAMIRVMMPSELFKKEYIQRYHLAYWVCQQTGYFSGKRFQFLTNFHPSLLLWLGNYGGLPLNFSFCIRNHLTVSSDDWLLLSILYQRKSDCVFYSEKIIVIIPCFNMYVSSNYINTRHIHWFRIISNNHSTPLVCVSLLLPQ